MPEDPEPIKIRDITIDGLIKGEFIRQLPELYRLKNVKDNNTWHNDESIFDQKINTLRELERIRNAAPYIIQRYLDQTLDENTQWDTLYTAALLKDVSKDVAWIKYSERLNAVEQDIYETKNIALILNRMFVSKLEQGVVLKIIRYDGQLQKIVDPKNENLEEQYDKLITQQSDIFVELNMFALAETASSELLRINNPSEYRFRIDFHKNMLNTW